MYAQAEFATKYPKLAQVLNGNDDDQYSRRSDVCYAHAEALLANCTQAQLEALRATDTEDDDVVAAAANVGADVVHAVYLAGIHV